jgi:hypothetical protein
MGARNYPSKKGIEYTKKISKINDQYYAILLNDGTLQVFSSSSRTLNVVTEFNHFSAYGAGDPSGAVNFTDMKLIQQTCDGQKLDSDSDGNNNWLLIENQKHSLYAVYESKINGQHDGQNDGKIESKLLLENTKTNQIMLVEPIPQTHTDYIRTELDYPKQFNLIFKNKETKDKDKENNKENNKEKFILLNSFNFDDSSNSLLKEVFEREKNLNLKLKFPTNSLYAKSSQTISFALTRDFCYFKKWDYDLCIFYDIEKKKQFSLPIFSSSPSSTYLTYPEEENVGDVNIGQILLPRPTDKNSRVVKNFEKGKEIIFETFAGYFFPTVLVKIILDFLIT